MRLFRISLFSLALIAGACTSGSDKVENQKENEAVSIAQEWELVEDSKNNGDNPSVVMSLEENGYFMIYNTFEGPKYSEAGIDKIQPISKGQWKYENEELILNHFDADTNRTDVFKVLKLSAKQLETISSTKKKHIYHIKK